MKAAIIQNFGEIPQYQDFADPIPESGEIIVDVKALVLENFDKGVTSGRHYSSRHFYPAFPAIVGHRGIGLTADGQLVSFSGLRPPYGAFAEKAVIKNYVPIPEGIDPAVAAAIPPSALTSYFPLKYTAKLQPGETVLINGATGVSGRMAIRVAQLSGAGRIIGTGRNKASLDFIKSLGAEIIDLKQDDTALLTAFKEQAVDVVLDFIWGHPAELLLQSLVPESLGIPAKAVRYVHIGARAGHSVPITGEMLRTSGLLLMGLGGVGPEEIAAGTAQVWEWIQAGKLTMDIEKVPLAAIETAWQRTDLAGKRLVIIP